MTSRKGISFTLTIVVVGVVLLMTALSLITLSGAGLNQFFETLTGKSEEAQLEAEIAEACSELAAEINNNYCDQYAPTEAFHDDGNADPKTADNTDDYMDSGGGDYWEVVDNNCDPSAVPGLGLSGFKDDRLPKSPSTAVDPGASFTNTLSDYGCAFDDEDVTVNVQGTQYSCVTENEFPTQSCPAGES